MSVEGIQAAPDTRNKKCPLLRGRKCFGATCAFWVEELLETTGGARKVEGCMLVLDHAYAAKSVTETIRVSAGLDKVASVGKSVAVAIERQSAAALVAGHPLFGLPPGGAPTGRPEPPF